MKTAKVTRTTKISESELAEFRQVYFKKFTGAADVSDSALIRHMAIRGCEAFKAEINTEKRTAK